MAVLAWLLWQLGGSGRGDRPDRSELPPPQDDRAADASAARTDGEQPVVPAAEADVPVIVLAADAPPGGERSSDDAGSEPRALEAPPIALPDLAPAPPGGGTRSGAAESPGSTPPAESAAEDPAAEDPAAEDPATEAPADHWALVIADRLPAAVARLRQATSTESLRDAWRRAADVESLPLQAAQRAELESARREALAAADDRLRDLLARAARGEVLTSLQAWRALGSVDDPQLAAALGAQLAERDLPTVPGGGATEGSSPQEPVPGQTPLCAELPHWEPGRRVRLLREGAVVVGTVLSAHSRDRYAVRVPAARGSGFRVPLFAVEDLEPVRARPSEALQMAELFRRGGGAAGRGPAVAWLVAARAAGLDAERFRAATRAMAR